MLTDDFFNLMSWFSWPQWTLNEKTSFPSTLLKDYEDRKNEEAVQKSSDKKSMVSYKDYCMPFFEKEIDKEDGKVRYFYYFDIPGGVNDDSIDVTVDKESSTVKVSYHSEVETKYGHNTQSGTKTLSIPKDAVYDSVDATFNNEFHYVVVKFDIEEDDDEIVVDFEDEEETVKKLDVSIK